MVWDDGVVFGELSADLREEVVTSVRRSWKVVSNLPRRLGLFGARSYLDLLPKVRPKKRTRNDRLMKGNK